MERTIYIKRCGDGLYDLFINETLIHHGTLNKIMDILGR